MIQPQKKNIAKDVKRNKSLLPVALKERIAAIDARNAKKKITSKGDFELADSTWSYEYGRRIE